MQNGHISEEVNYITTQANMLIRLCYWHKIFQCEHMHKPGVLGRLPPDIEMHILIIHSIQFDKKNHKPMTLVIKDVRSNSYKQL